jgi:hypothetical protein
LLFIFNEKVGVEGKNMFYIVIAMPVADNTLEKKIQMIKQGPGAVKTMPLPEFKKLVRDCTQGLYYL